MDKLKNRAIEILVSFWLLIVAVQFLYRSPLLADSSVDYKFAYIGMAFITAIGVVKAFLDYKNGNREGTMEVAPCRDNREAVRRSRRSRR
jgi:hypothetical protein